MTSAELAGGPDPNPPTPAATVVCLRPGPEGPEVLLLRRRSRGAFGGMWVFPGGKVDPGDRDWGDRAPGDVGAPGGGAGVEDGAGRTGDVAPADDEIAAGRRAAVREAAEEAGLVIDPASMATLSYWLPPAEAARRFSTWFYVAAVVGQDPIVLSHDEVGAHRWERAADMLAAHSAGEVELAPPTWMTLHWLTAWGTVDEALAAARGRPPERFLTRAAMGSDARLAATVWEGDVAYDDLDVDPARPGSRRRLVLADGGWELLLDPVGERL